MCSTPVERCLPATCQSDTECGEGQLCTRYYAFDDFGWGAFACDTVSDQCNSDDDCFGSEYPRSCVRVDGARMCVEGARAVY